MTWTLSIHDPAFHSMLSRVTIAASSDSSRRILTHVAFTDEWVMATDSYMAVRIPVDWFGTVTGKIGQGRRVTVPKNLFKRAMGPSGASTITITKDEMVIKAHGMSCHIPLADEGGFPNIGTLFEGTPDVDLRAFLSVELLKRTATIFGQRNDLVLAPFGRYRPARVLVGDTVVGLAMPIKLNYDTYDDVFGQIEGL